MLKLGRPLSPRARRRPRGRQVLLQGMEKGKALQRLSLLGLEALERAVAASMSSEVCRGEDPIQSHEQRPLQGGYPFIVDDLALSQRFNRSLKRSAADKRLYVRIFEFSNALDIQVKWIVKEPA